MDKIPKLGSLITDTQHRDAVHIAVAPVTAGEDLRPGDRIGFTGNAFTVGTDARIVGIVDPFLCDNVKKGQQFYMFLFPNTITSLRHEWTHPDFEREEELLKAEPTFQKLSGPTAEQNWISEFAESIDSSYDEIMEGADNYVRRGDYLVRGGTFEGISIPEVFWDKYEVIRKTKVDGSDRGTFLGCSC